VKELPNTLLGFETTSPSPPCPFCRAPFAGETGGDLAPGWGWVVVAPLGGGVCGV